MHATGPVPDIISVVIADDHPMFLAGLRAVIAREEDIHLAEEAGDGREALAAIERSKPHVVVLDIEMPLMNGLDVARELRRRQLPTSIIFLTMYDERDMFEQAVELGAAGYLLKDSAVIEVVRGIRKVAGGDFYITPAFTGGASHAARARAGLPDLSALTPAEHRVLSLVALDKSTNEIAEELYISPRTVDRHRATICSKLNLRGSFSLLRFAIEHRLFLAAGRSPAKGRAPED